MTREAPVLIVPGLRDHVAEHLQKLLRLIAPRLLVARYGSNLWRISNDR